VADCLLGNLAGQVSGRASDRPGPDRRQHALGARQSHFTAVHSGTSGDVRLTIIPGEEGTLPPGASATASAAGTTWRRYPHAYEGGGLYSRATHMKASGQVTRTGYAQDGTPLRVMVTIAPGDRKTLVYETDAT
jgi:hypothetical protein